MEQSPKRLNRRTFWMWVVLLVLGHALANLSTSEPGSSAPFPMIGIDEVILILLAIALARRFRHIGWPVWIGPTILLGTIGLPLLGIGIALMNDAVDPIKQWLPLWGPDLWAPEPRAADRSGVRAGQARARGKYRSRAGVRVRCLSERASRGNPQAFASRASSQAAGRIHRQSAS